MSNLLERARARKAEIDTRHEKLEAVRAAIESIGTIPTLTELRALLTALRDMFKGA